MGADTRGFGSGFVEGFGLIDDFYRKNKEEKRQAGRDAAADEAAAAARANDDRRTSIMETTAKTEAEVAAARMKEAEEASKAHRENAAFLREQRALAARKQQDEMRAEKALQVMHRIYNGETPTDAEMADLGEYNPLRFVRPEFTQAVSSLAGRVTQALSSGGDTTGANWDKLLDESIPDIQKVYGPRIAASIGDTVNGKRVKGIVIDDIKPGKVAGDVMLEIGYETADGRRGTMMKSLPLNDMLEYLHGTRMTVEGIRRDPRFTAQLASLARAYDKRPESMALLGDSLASYAQYKKDVYAQADAEWQASVAEAANQGTPPPDRTQFINAYTRANTMDQESYAQQFTMTARGEDRLSAKDARTIKREYGERGITLTSNDDISQMRDIELDASPDEVSTIASAYQKAKFSVTPRLLKNVLAELDASAPTPTQEKVAQMAAQGLTPPEEMLRQSAAEGMQRNAKLKQLLKKRLPQPQTPREEGAGLQPLPPAGNSFSALLRS